MSEPTWTKGPWTVDPECNCDIQDISGEIEVATTHPANMPGGQTQADRARANAHLIASAPELYEAANRLSILYDEIWVQMSDGEMALCKEAWKAMDAALAKARGETS